MANDFITSNITSSSATVSTVTAAATDEVFVAPNVDVVDEGGAGAYAIDFTSYGSANIEGAVFGPTALYFGGAFGIDTSVQISAAGSLEASHDGALVVATGNYHIDNAGDIQNSGADGVDLDFDPSTSTIGAGDGTLVNSGVISTEAGNAIKESGGGDGESDTVDNYGQISATQGYGLDDTGAHSTIVNNYGSISAAGFAIIAAGDETLTNAGQISGEVSLGAGSTIKNSGEIDGDVALAGDDFTDTGAVDGYVTLTNGRSSNAVVGQGGFIGVTGSQADSLRIVSGPFQIQNSGSVAGVSVDYDWGTNSAKSGAGEIDNHGDIETLSSAVFAVFIDDTTARDLNVVDNTGIIRANSVTIGVYSYLSSFQIENQGTIEAGYGVDAFGDETLINSGTITGAGVGVENFAGSSGDDYVFNSGVISGGAAIEDFDGHVARIVNEGQISGGTAVGDAAVYTDGSTQERLVNGGTISGAISLGAANSTIVNSGAIDGNIAFGGGSGRLVNSGSIDGSVTFSGAGNVYLGQGGSFTGTVTGASADDRFYGGAGDEYFDLTGAGAKVAVGGAGTTTFDYGADFTNAMAVSGGAGTTIVDLEGNYAGANELFLGARTMVGVSKLTLGAGFNYAIVANASTVGNGQTMTVDGSALGSGNTLLFDASHDVGGFYDFIGGAGQNTFTFATYNLFANDVVQAGAGASNILRFITAGDVTAQQMANVSGVSTIKLQAGTNDIQLNDFMVTKASGHALTVNLSTGDDTIDASLLTTASNTVTINATTATGGDVFDFGAAKEIVDFGASPTSQSVNYDTINDFNFAAGDAISIAGFTPAAIASSATGALSTATFDADLSAALGTAPGGQPLLSDFATLFTATSGTLAGATFLVVNTSSNVGYSAGDLVVRLTGTTKGTLGLANL